MSPKYYLKDDEFVIENYNEAKPFSSFLPGIAGLYGKPLWAFYVNRGQCIASFGMNSKDGAIMEFYPANTAYRRVTLEGFRTFLKYTDHSGKSRLYEPFHLHLGEDASPKQIMYVSPHEIRLEEVSGEHGFRFEVVFHTIPGEDFPALARTVRVENLTPSSRRVEIIDGMPKLMPYGLNEWFMKNMSCTIEAWMEVSGAASRRPFYRLRVDAADVAETKYITSGNFYLSIVGGSRLRPDIIVDPRVVFGLSGDLVHPGAFASDRFNVPARQIDRNITPSALSHCVLSIPGRKSAAISSMIGHAASLEQLQSIDGMLSDAFFADKRALNREETMKAASTVSVFSGIREFDAYTRQTNLDNILRGGLPITLGPDGKVIYVFNRKHGDLERDYNNFVVRAENFAQGNGNYRDTNQNRRLSVWLNPAVLSKDIRDFYDLIQLDGFNPLVIKGDRFSIKGPAARKRIAARHFDKKDSKEAQLFLAGDFTVGELMEFAEKKRSTAKGRLLCDVVRDGTLSIQAEHGEGYWIDHWTYNLDLVESFLALYPEKKRELLFGEDSYRFFDNDHVVKPRSEKTVIDPHGRIRQYHAVCLDAEKRGLIASRKTDPSWARTKHGSGPVYKCTLAAKMLVITANKIASLDPSGIGIEMEADKPAWCDSMNGMPALFGSSCSETFELARLVRFLIEAINDAGKISVALPQEAAAFIKDLTSAMKKATQPHLYWARSGELKERYRSRTRLGLDGKEATFTKNDILDFLLASARILERGIEKAHNADGIPYTYFIHDANNPKPVSLFLEGVVHALKIQGDERKARNIYEHVRKSGLYDTELGMYKLSASLEGEPLEIGRSRAFTPGWLENESVWLHMEYKYLLEILRCGLYEEFFADFKKALIPFQDAERYGRPILENSSFLASSSFFDHNLVGNGFYARLSGATVEFLNMLHIMNLGASPFILDPSTKAQGSGARLIFKPIPVLKKEFFNPEGRTVEFAFKKGARQVKLPPRSYSFSIFGKTLITYENPRMKDTFGKLRIWPARYHIRYAAGKTRSVEGRTLGEPFSKDLRSGLIDHLTITLE